MRDVRALYRYPIKGLSPELLSEVHLQAGRGFPLDRAFALTNGTWVYDPAAYLPRPKTDFLMLMLYEKLATLRTRVDEESHRLTVQPPHGDGIGAELDDAEALQRVADFVGTTVGDKLPGRPQLVREGSMRFTDVSVVSPTLANAISLVNLATVRDLERIVGRPVNPLRFRANVYFEGASPWEEMDWLGKDIYLGPVRVRVVRRTRRCAATNVDPETGSRDLNIPLALVKHFRHGDLGVYAEVATDGVLRPGAELDASGA